MNEVMMAADASSMRGGGATSFASSPSSNLLPNNLPLLTAFLAFALAQFLKLFTNWFKERRWDSKRMIDSGGMPSSHSATVTALAVAIGLQDGMGGPAFAIAVVLACVEYCWWQSLLSIFFSLTFLFPLIDAMAIDLTTSASMSLTMLISMVMYDASGVRLHAGRQAELLNQIVCEFPPEHPLSSVRPLRELLGHTPLQVVAGALVGFIVAFLMRNSG
ncbi:hypothetical protein ERO13_D07G176900v2 [Gossypium hirsutum]|uniref:Uncharacterized protein n=10 Tax=Gossypium TaxID=3633 RepID=A0A0D2NBS3_GOSRA|nr:uncharacterized protein LOC105800428 isoform X1 [Gossypium raimondii]XP_012487038.1 uncharacterized protein LOC105800428 isoform X1 [Gossypium raimondii]XP_016745902.1 uncharacterized membrane protein YuiD isoform X1 [Gossypium hirsutum]TYH63619.1 hypothetical protein ES332_D07G205300v1 [Gossypium tomentosum]TYI74429.1 hypothetical protein E1A91_D07G199000v1 [Gossypium mustelinum]KAG4139204.1 hypothetical protein ERO13_D07G176900v2 [Gossypium hirsutum]KJB10368.1 hypothetical protein B456_0